MIIPRPHNLCLLNPTWMLEKKQQETLRITNIIESRHDGKSSRISQHCLHLLRDLAGLPKAPTSPDAKDLELCYAGFARAMASQWLGVQFLCRRCGRYGDACQAW